MQKTDEVGSGLVRYQLCKWPGQPHDGCTPFEHLLLLIRTTPPHKHRAQFACNIYWHPTTAANGTIFFRGGEEEERARYSLRVSQSTPHLLKMVIIVESHVQHISSGLRRGIVLALHQVPFLNLGLHCQTGDELSAFSGFTFHEMLNLLYLLGLESFERAFWLES